jgi:very-short-patch-repair endonuclease
MFQYLEAFNQQRNPVVRQVDEQDWALRLKSLPAHQAITLGKGDGDSFVLKVDRPRLTRPPAPPAEIREWLQPGWDDPARAERIVESNIEKGRAGEEHQVNFNDEPERVRSYKQWAVKRGSWAEQERPAREAFKVFERVYALYNRLEREAGRLELVLGDGLLNWRQPSGGINHPLLLQRIELTFAPKIPQFTFQLTAQPAEFYTSLLRTVVTLGPKLIAQFHDECEQASFDLLDVETTEDFLRGVAARLSSAGQFVAEEGLTVETDEPRLTLEPTIIARQRTLGYARAIEVILGEIPDVEFGAIPTSLLNLAGVEAPESAPEEAGGVTLDGGGNEDREILFNKPANPEQLLIAKRLERHGCVLVQGPPGTGKTHTIANLIGHLLAEGRSVLVTSHTTKALDALRDKIDARVQSLCVSVLNNDAESQAQMGAAISEIAERLNHDPSDLERKAAELKEGRADIIAKLRMLRTRLFEARASEYRALSVGGKLFEPSAAARLVRDGRGKDDWIPGPAKVGHGLPLDEREVAELYRTNRLVSAADEDDLAATLPNPELLMPAQDFSALVRDLASLGPPTAAHHEGLWNPRITTSPEALIELLTKSRTVVEPVIQGMSDPFKMALLNDSRRGGVYRAPWDELVGKVEAVAEAAADCRVLILTYGPEPAASISHAQQVKILEEIISHLSGGGGLGKVGLLFRSEWKNFIAQASVDGNSPSELAHFKALHAALSLELMRGRLISRWDRQMTPLGAPSAGTFRPHPEEGCSRYVEQIRNLLSWQDQAWRPFEKTLREAGFEWEAFVRGVPLNFGPNGDLSRLADAVLNHLPPVFEARITSLRRSALERRLAAHHSEIRVKLATGQSAGLLGELLGAVEARDADSYAEVSARIIALHARHQAYLRRRELLARLEASAPGWARAVRSRSGVHARDVVPGDVKRAWLWRQLSDQLDQSAEDSIEEIQAEIGQRTSDLNRVTAELIEASAWAAQIRRTKLPQKQALNGWVQTMRKVGRGTGKRVPSLLAQARKLMEECRTAVPVWVMPLNRVVESYQPTRGLFDVVIIDEASQCDVMGLIALYLGKKVIVVGDHEQVSPDAVGKTVEAAQSLVDTYLQGIPNAQLYDGKLSIYDLAMQSFSGSVCLREHFRCVPEIIGFSNELSYDGKIKPLRDSSHNPLSHAVIAHHVHGGMSDEKVNEAEVQTIASLIAAAVEQPEYEGQTFGVISLVGGGQAVRIEQLLRAKLHPTEFTERKITCGSAAQFQGDERQVMFLSVVDGSGDGPLRMRQDELFKKRFNVAASRAQNQLWVVHSLWPAVDLQPGDLRRRLIEYAQNRQARARAMDAQLERTESEFERQVVRRLLAAGYHVTPQWKVGSYRIDMVVSGGGKRIALECDGDRWHPPEKIPADMERQAILERIGWRFIRIRGTKFFRDPEGVMRGVLAKLDAYGVTPGAGFEVAEEETTELAARVIGRAEQLRAEWSQSLKQ